MHQSADICIDGLSKIEGNASIEIKIEDNKVKGVHFKIAEGKRFFTRSMEGKPIAAIPQLLSRICGTCSNAHLLCAIEACERALDITPSDQTMALRHLTMYGLNIRDHALHLYLFAMPDLFGKDAFLEFDENDPLQHQLLHDAFEIKAAGNYLSTIIAGRCVHAMNPTIGGYFKIPTQEEVDEAISKLEAIRPAALRLIKVFEDCDFRFDRKTHYMGLVSEEKFCFLEGIIINDTGERIEEKNFADHLEHVVLPYSEASAYTYHGKSYLVGALARINLEKDILHKDTIASLGKTLDRFPSTNIFDNNLAQAIEVLHSIDDALELLRSHTFKKEALIKKPNRDAVGVGVIEAPRGLLFHQIELQKDGKIKQGKVVVPTGQNQVNIEADVGKLVEDLLPKMDRDKIPAEIEKLIRAYDPCISCAVHFLKVKWS